MQGEGAQVVQRLGDVMSSEMLSADQYLNVLHSRGQRRLPLRRVYRNMRRRGLFLIVNMALPMGLLVSI